MVRVSIRPERQRWRVTITERGSGLSATAISHFPPNAVKRALSKAVDRSIKGIDTHMEWSYTHPMFEGAKEGELDE